MKNIKKWIPHVSLFSAAVLAASLLSGANREWTTGNGEFNMPGNWTGNAIPGTEDYAIFTPDGDYSVTLDENATVLGVHLNSGSANKKVTLDLGGNILTTTSNVAATPGLNVSGTTGVSRVLEITNGTFSSGIVRINGGAVATDHGKLIVSNGGIYRTQAGDHRIANVGHGIVEIRNGGTWDNLGTIRIGSQSNGNGLVVVEGTGSTWTNDSGSIQTVDVGQSGTGRIEIRNGGQATGMNTYLGRNAGASGEVLVTGTGSLFSGNGLYAGGTGGDEGLANAKLEAVDGGVIRFRSLTMHKGSLHLDGGQLELIGTGTSTFSENSLIEVTLYDPASPIMTTNAIDLGDAELQLAIGEEFSGVLGDTFTLLRYNTTLTGQFLDIDDASVIDVGGYSFLLNYGTGNDSAITLQMTAIPEPGLTTALIMALCLAVGVRYRIKGNRS